MKEFLTERGWTAAGRIAVKSISDDEWLEYDFRHKRLRKIVECDAGWDSSINVVTFLCTCRDADDYAMALKLMGLTDTF